AGELKEFLALLSRIGREQLLALVKAEDRERKGRLGHQGTPGRDPAQLAQKLDEALGRGDALAQLGAVRAQREPALRGRERREEALAPFERAAASGADRRQRKPLAVVTQKPRPNPGAQE